MQLHQFTSQKPWHSQCHQRACRCSHVVHACHAQHGASPAVQAAHATQCVPPPAQRLKQHLVVANTCHSHWRQRIAAVASATAVSVSAVFSPLPPAAAAAGQPAAAAPVQAAHESHIGHRHGSSANQATPGTAAAQ